MYSTFKRNCVFGIPQNNAISFLLQFQHFLSEKRKNEFVTALHKPISQRFTIEKKNIQVMKWNLAF